MTDTRRCAQVRELAPEVALGVASVEDRAFVLGHATSCAECRSQLADLSTLADDLLTLVPPVEPPNGFETTVLGRLGGPAAAPRHRERRRLLGLAAALLLVASASGGAVYWSGRDDREVAAGLRSSLQTANGQYFVAFALRDLGGVQRGAVFAYQGNPAWMFITVTEGLPAGGYAVELVIHDGSTRRLAAGVDLARSRGWGAAIPVAVHDARLLRIVDGDGRLALSARLTR
ncbi:hypothetical protein OG394_03980 [Kribbella sp. NBC_01245]|uniref:hypothetical protein n=1 Tax=Kribbella sp. NBC_01245 TaxID=2903578 RepID=UPI002E2B7B58|nr:hypothetical protein [Kribbella sp. NBC_01245]